MNHPLATVLQSVTSKLERLKARWSLIGGIAVSARSEPRFTRDIDFAVAVDNDTQAEKLTFELAQSGLTILATIEQEATQRLATVRFATQHVSVIADVLFASSGIENEIVNAATVTEVFTNVHAPVARTGHLIALKVLSKNDETRPQDLVDLYNLLMVADEEERNLTREALQLIEQRGFNRNKNLLQDFEVLLERCPLS